jgi:dihydrofolate reductase
MSKLVVTTFVTLDGVMQAPGGPDEDRSGGFEHGGWLVPHFDEATGAFMTEVFERVGSFLLGRKTYDIFTGHWPHVTDEDDPIAFRLNTLPKYVASRSLEQAEWQNSTVIRDVPTEVAALKEQPGGELQVHGSGQLIRWLLEHELVDEMTLIVCPVIVGAGTRLFPDEGRDFALELVESRTFRTGIIVQTYRPDGRPQYAS